MLQYLPKVLHPTTVSVAGINLAFRPAKNLSKGIAINSATRLFPSTSRFLGTAGGW